MKIAQDDKISLSGSHVKTWRSWIDNLSPIGESVSAQEREVMAEALAIAAPQGPRGVLCEDECRCDDSIARLAIGLFEEVCKQATPVVQVQSLMRDLQDAIRRDSMSGRVRSTNDFPMAELSRTFVVVSSRNADVIAARVLWAATWETIRRGFGLDRDGLR